jgi:hypothetical protein
VAAGGACVALPDGCAANADGRPLATREVGDGQQQLPIVTQAIIEAG